MSCPVSPVIAVLADFPVHRLPGFESTREQHHATWLPILAKALQTRCHGYSFHWVTFTKATDCYRRLEAWGQIFHLLPRRRLSIEMLTGFLRERREIAALLRSIQPEIVHAWGTEQGYGLAANDFPGPSLLSIQGILTAYCRNAPMPMLVKVQARHERRVLRRMGEITVESDWGKRQVSSLAPEASIDLLEYGVDPDCFEVSRSPSRTPLALAVGSLSVLKGTDTLFNAFRDRRLAHIELVVLGDGDPEFSEAADLPGNVRLMGFVSPEEVRKWMSRAWCLVHPTRADTSPNCVKEARVIGLPVVTTPNGGQTQYIVDGQSGIVHEAGDTEGLIHGVLAVTKDLETSFRMGKQGQSKCRGVLSPANTANNLLQVYRALLGY